MRLNKFIDGLTILQRYFDDPTGYHIGSEHDQFFVYTTSRPVSDDDQAKLAELGWFQPEQEDGDPYDPEQCWSAFT